MLPSIGSSRSILLQVCQSRIVAARILDQSIIPQFRSFASVVPDASVPAKSSTKAIRTETDGRLRPHLGIKVNPTHGLYAFFRKKAAEDGSVSHESVEIRDMSKDGSGRSWTAAELRRKSFNDLHTLWYVLLRERNLLATQKEELRRMGGNPNYTGVVKKAFSVRKSMARIKYVINERRLAYTRAAAIHEQNRMKLLEENRKRRAMKEAEVAAVEAEATSHAAERNKEQKHEQGTQPAETVAADILGTTADVQSTSSKL